MNDIRNELGNGARFVVFQYCFSIIIMSFRRNSEVYFIRKDESTLKYSIESTLLTLIFGWWGIPWGPVFSIGAIVTNLKGGIDMTKQVTDSFSFKLMSTVFKS